MPDVRHYAEMRQYGLDLGRDELQRQAFNLMEALSPADLTVQELQQFVLFLRPIYRRASKGTDH
jgi:hypothetical protein